MLSPPARALAATIRAYIRAAETNTRELAGALGRTHTTLVGWCAGSVPRAEHLDALLAELDVPEGERAEVRALRAAATDQAPDWPGAATAVRERAGVPAELAANVLDALAGYCEASPAACETSITARDLRIIAANITH